MLLQTVEMEFANAHKHLPRVQQAKLAILRLTLAMVNANAEQEQEHHVLDYQQDLCVILALANAHQR